MRNGGHKNNWSRREVLLQRLGRENDGKPAKEGKEWASMRAIKECLNILHDRLHLSFDLIFPTFEII